MYGFHQMKTFLNALQKVKSVATKRRPRTHPFIVVSTFGRHSIVRLRDILIACNPNTSKPWLQLRSAQKFTIISVQHSIPPQLQLRLISMESTLSNRHEDFSHMFQNESIQSNPQFEREEFIYFLF